MSLHASGRRFLRGIAEEFETSRYVWLTLAAVVYLILVLLRSFRPLWFDELYTYNVVTLPTLRDAWVAYTKGADSNPPLFHLITRASVWIFGPTELGLRVPGIIAFFVLCVCLYVFVSRRAGATFGFAAMFLPWVTGAFPYASEGRPYGLVLGFSGLALVSWQKALEPGRRRLLFLGCMSAALTAAILCHAYAILLPVTFGIAQMVRDYRRRAPDWIAWAFLVVPFAGCLSYLPLISVLRPAIINSPVFRPTWHSLPDFYNFLLSPALWPLLFGAIAVLVAARRDETAGTDESWKPEEIALALGFLVVPLLEIFMATFVTNAFMPRYGLPAVIGVAILFTAAAAKSTSRSRQAGAALAMLMVAWSVGSFATFIAVGVTSSQEPAVSLEQRPELPLVISSGLIYYEMNHYAPPERVSRTWYLLDRTAALRFTGTDIFEGFPELNRLFRLRAKLADYHSFLRSNPHFLVYGYASYPNDWLVSKLMEDGARLNFLGRRTEEFGPAVLYEAQMPEPTESSAR